jgi:hypothetical protein
VEESVGGIATSKLFGVEVDEGGAKPSDPCNEGVPRVTPMTLGTR